MPVNSKREACGGLVQTVAYFHRNQKRSGSRQLRNDKISPGNGKPERHVARRSRDIKKHVRLLIKRRRERGKQY